MEPRLVGDEIGERETFQAGVFQSADVVLDMGVGPYETIQLGGVVFLVGVVTPEPVLQVGEQRCLRPGVQRFASDDQPSALGPRRGTFTSVDALIEAIEV